MQYLLCLLKQNRFWYFFTFLLSGHNVSSTCCCDRNCLLGWWFLFCLPMGICCWIHSFHDDHISWIYCSTIWQIHSIARGRTKNWNRTVGCQYWLSTLQVICCRRFKKVKMFWTKLDSLLWRYQLIFYVHTIYWS